MTVRRNASALPAIGAPGTDAWPCWNRSATGASAGPPARPGCGLAAESHRRQSCGVRQRGEGVAAAPRATASAPLTWCGRPAFSANKGALRTSPAETGAGHPAPSGRCAPAHCCPASVGLARPRERLPGPIKIALYGTLPPLRLTRRRPSQRCRGGPPARAAAYAPATVRANRVRPWSSMKSSRSPSAAKAQARNPCAPETKPARLGGPGRYVSEPVPDVA